MVTFIMIITEPILHYHAIIKWSLNMEVLIVLDLEIK